MVAKAIRFILLPHPQRFPLLCAAATRVRGRRPIPQLPLALLSANVLLRGQQCRKIAARSSRLAVNEG